MYFLPLLAAACFVGSLPFRLLDPVVPEIARDLATTANAVALLSTAFLITYSIAQPFVGVLADAAGKVRLIKLCIAAMTLMLVVMAFAPSIEVLYISRIVGGVFASGIFTVALAIVGDRIALAERQVALSRLIMASQLSHLFGVAASGLVAAEFGWRASVGSAAVVSALVCVLVWRYLTPRPGVVRIPFSLGRLGSNARLLFANPRTFACYCGVLLDGMAVTGALPFIAVLLEQRGQGGLREAGLVIAGMGLGGILYTLLVRHLLALVGGMLNLLRFGGIVCAAGLAATAMGGPWPTQMAGFVVAGLGFFMVHASLQAQATDVAPELRATSVSLHSTFFCLGTGLGPALYAVGIHALGAKAAMLIGALVILGIGFMVAARLEDIAEAEAAAQAG